MMRLSWVAPFALIVAIVAMMVAMTGTGHAKKATIQGELGKMVRVKRGETVVFPEFQMIFDSHSHKSARAGETSPLIVYLYFITSGRREPFPLTLDVDDHGTAKWKWRKYRFTLVDYDYNKWMKLIVK
jgi:hypothetical protein